MKRRSSTALFYSLLLRLIPIGLGFAGWHFAGWLGAIGGFFIGCFAAVGLWATGYSIGFNKRLRKQREEMSKLSIEQLQTIATDPMAKNMAAAMSELDRRGIEARPSLESIFQLLTSSDGRQRGMALTLLTLYPAAFSKIQDGWSSNDAPEFGGNESPP